MGFAVLYPSYEWMRLVGRVERSETHRLDTTYLAGPRTEAD